MKQEELEGFRYLYNKELKKEKKDIIILAVFAGIITGVLIETLSLNVKANDSIKAAFTGMGLGICLATSAFCLPNLIKLQRKMRKHYERMEELFKGDMDND